MQIRKERPRETGKQVFRGHFDVGIYAVGFRERSSQIEAIWSAS